MQTQSIPLALIDDTDRLRPVDPSWADVMAEDLLRGVALPPIVVRPASAPEIMDECRYALVIGGHRMAAHRLAGLDAIRADIIEISRAEARILEVDENLKRHELNALDRAIMLLARKQAFEEAYPHSAHGRAPKGRKDADEKSQTLRLYPERFTAEAAAKVGLAERTVQADIELAQKLAPGAIGYLRTTDLVDNAAELRRLAGHSSEEQVALATAIAKGDARTVAQARIILTYDAVPERDPQERIFNSLADLWSRTNARTRRRFEEHQALVAKNGRGAA